MDILNVLLQYWILICAFVAMIVKIVQLMLDLKNVRAEHRELKESTKMEIESLRKDVSEEIREFKDFIHKEIEKVQSGMKESSISSQKMAVDMATLLANVESIRETLKDIKEDNRK